MSKLISRARADNIILSEIGEFNIRIAGISTWLSWMKLSKSVGEFRGRKKKFVMIKK